MNPTVLLSETHLVLILLAVVAVYAALALGYSLLQWRYASGFRREQTKEKLARIRQDRRGGAGQAQAVDVIVPCYDEDPALLYQCCTALERQRSSYPGAIHVWLIDDGSRRVAGLEPVFRRFGGLPGWTVIRHPGNRGKRHAQNSAFRQGSGVYVVTVDSDTILRVDCIARLVAAMERSPQAGAISGYIRARNATGNRLTGLIDKRYEFLFWQERAAQSWHRAVTCCSGPLSIYRRAVLDRIWARYVDDRFLGWQRNFGDDLKLTLLVLEQTYDSLFEPSARAWTLIPDTLAGYVRQQVRWNKSFYRELPCARRALRRHLHARYLGVPGAHHYVRFELAVRLLAPLLAPALLAACAWVSMAGHGAGRWLPLLAMVTVMGLHAVVVGLQCRSWTFPLRYGLLHLTVLLLVRLHALLTLADSRWGTRNSFRP